MENEVALKIVIKDKIRKRRSRSKIYFTASFIHVFTLTQPFKLKFSI